jgi:hypothetical protein
MAFETGSLRTQESHGWLSWQLPAELAAWVVAPSGPLHRRLA